MSPAALPSSPICALRRPIAAALLLGALLFLRLWPEARLHYVHIERRGSAAVLFSCSDGRQMQRRVEIPTLNLALDGISESLALPLPLCRLSAAAAEFSPQLGARARMPLAVTVFGIELSLRWLPYALPLHALLSVLGVLLCRFALSALRRICEARRWSAFYDPRLALLLIPALQLFILRRQLFGDRSLLFVDVGFDIYDQYVPFLTHWARAWAEHGRLFWPHWTFNVGLGTNVGTYTLEPFMLLLVMLGERAIAAGLAWTLAIKNALSGLVFYAYLGRLGLGRAYCLIGGLTLSACGFSLVWGQHPQFAALQLAVVCLLYGARTAAARTGAATVMAASAVLAVMSLFFWWAAGLFLLAVLLSWGPSAPLRAVLTRYAAGLGLAAVLALPSAMTLLGSDRFARLHEYALSHPTYADRFLGLFRLVSADIFGTGSWYAGPGNYYEAPAIGIGMLMLLALLAAVRVTAPRAALPLLLSAAALVVPWVAAPFNAFATDYHRELSLFFTLAAITTALQGVEHRVQREGGMRFSGPALLVALILAVLLATGKPVDWRVITEASALLILSLATVGAAPPRALPALATLLVLFEAGLAAERPLATGRFSLTYSALTSSAGYHDDSVEALRELTSRDGAPFRVAKLYRSVFYLDALAQGYRGFESYFPYQSAAYVRFLEEQGLPRPFGGRILPGLADRWDLYGALGAKYFLTRSDGARPPGEVVLQHGDVSVIQNPLFRAPARLVDRPAAGSWSLLSPERADLGRVTVEAWDEARLRGRFNSTADSALFVAIPREPGWRAYVDGRRTVPDGREGSFFLLPVSAGRHYFELRFIPPGLLLGGFVSLSTLLVLVLGLVRIRVGESQEFTEAASPTAAE